MSVIHNIFIANRGEIAVRIIRTAKQMGICCFVAYSPEERDALYVRLANHAFALEDSSLHDSFLNIKMMVSLAKENGIQAIHPGYGFLSENHDFALACEQAGIIFIGPGAEQIRLMSNKISARQHVASLNVPMLHVPEFDLIYPTFDSAEQLKYPLLIKAASGGGGKGMHIANNAEELLSHITIAQREAFSYFGNGEVYLEQFLKNPRHIEVQLLGDTHGNLIHLFDRECTIQRRHQKIIEEAPSDSISEVLRKKLITASLKIGNSIGYYSAGTIEFLVDQEENFYFLEMNTRIQVEHAVTEMVTNVDLVREQINIASGMELSLKQKDIRISGHALECRICAESPLNDFLPASGKVIAYKESTAINVRTDSGFDGPGLISTSFDSLIAKVAVLGDNRGMAISGMEKALQETIIQGIQTNLSFLHSMIKDNRFVENKIDTGFCSAVTRDLLQTFEEDLKLIPKEVLACLYLIGKQVFSTSRSRNLYPSLWQSFGYWNQFMRFKLQSPIGVIHAIYFKIGYNTFRIQVDGGEEYKISFNQKDAYIHINFKEDLFKAYVSQEDGKISVSMYGLNFVLHIPLSAPENRMDNNVSEPITHRILASMHGKILQINIGLRDRVKKGDVLMIVESMKMENHILAPYPGIVESILVNKGDKVGDRDVLAIVVPS